MDIAMIVLAMYFASILGISGMAKIRHPQSFEFTLRKHSILSPKLIPWVALFLPWLQVAVAFSLLVGVMHVLVAFLVVALFTSFLLIEATLVRSRRNVDCGCYGLAFPQKVDGVSLIVSAIQVAFAIGYLVALVSAGESFVISYWHLAMLPLAAFEVWLLVRTCVNRWSERSISIGRVDIDIKEARPT